MNSFFTELTWEHTRQFNTQPFNGLLSGTTRVGRYQKKHSPTHTHPDHRTSFIILITIHGILFVQFTSLTVLSDNLSPGPLWSSLFGLFGWDESVVDDNMSLLQRLWSHGNMALYKFCIVFLLALDPQLHTPCISSPNRGDWKRKYGKRMYRRMEYMQVRNT